MCVCVCVLDGGLVTHRLFSRILEYVHVQSMVLRSLFFFGDPFALNWKLRS